MNRPHVSCTVAGVLLALVVFGPGASAAVVKNISTGIDPATGAKIANNTAQNAYVIAPGGTGGQVGQTIIAWSEPIYPFNFPSTYVPDDASTRSRWISIYPPDQPNPKVDLGTFFYQTSVDLTGYDPATAVIAAPRFAVDDTFNGVLVNGTRVFTPPPPGYYANMDSFLELPDLGAGAFHAGINTITFIVENVAQSSPASLRLEASVTATPVPEPAAVWIVVVAGATLARRHRHLG